MKNKVFIVSLIATIISFSLYFANLKRVKNSSINIIEPKTSKTIPTKKVKEPKPKIKEPKIKTIEYANHVKVASGSQKKLAQKIEQIMGKDYSYQVAVQDLNNPAKFCRVANTKVAHNVDDTMKLYLLLAIYEQEQQGKLTSKTVIKIKKSDRVNGEKALKTNMSYGISFLRQAMMRGNKTAANALIRKVGHDKIDAIIKKLGADQTTMSAMFSFARQKRTRKAPATFEAREARTRGCSPLVTPKRCSSGKNRAVCLRTDAIPIFPSAVLQPLSYPCRG